jgi:hypothetical protein
MFLTRWLRGTNPPYRASRHRGPKARVLEQLEVRTVPSCRELPGRRDAWSVAAGDFNGDGASDLATANVVGNSVSILLGAGDGSFVPGGEFGVGRRPFALAAGDFNFDGALDLAVGSQSDNNVGVVLGLA